LKPNLKLFKELVNVSDLKTLKSLNRIILKQIDLLSTDKNKVNIPVLEVNPIFDTSKPREFVYHILHDEWTSTFSKYSNNTKNHYVYIHVDPNKVAINFRYNKHNLKIKKPYYVGMGTGNRVYSFKRSVSHTKTLNSFIKKGYNKKEFMIIFKYGLTEQEARILESKLILIFGVMTAVINPNKNKKKSPSGNAPCLYNNQYEPVPSKYDIFTFI